MEMVSVFFIFLRRKSADMSRTAMRNAAFFLFVCSLLGLSSCKPSPEKAMEYYNKTLDCQQAVLEKEDDLIVLINKEMNKTLMDSASSNIPQTADTSSNKGLIDAAYAEFCLQIKKSQRQMKEIGGFDNKTALLDATNALLETYRQLSEKEYKEVVAIVKIPSSIYTNEDDNRFLDLTERIDTCLQSQIDQFTRDCKAFARQYQFEIEDPETNK
jgi:hypothetical protein